jgi:deoxycytidylate deaminase
MNDDDLGGLARNKFFKKAIEAINSHPHFNELSSVHASVLIKGGHILAVGINKPKKNGFINVHKYHTGCNIHSECDAILKARKKSNLRGAKIYIARIRKDNNKAGMSKPCLMCCRVIQSYGIKKVYYSTNEGFETMGRGDINDFVTRENNRISNIAA